jgi:hypothetical protein
MTEPTTEYNSHPTLLTQFFSLIADQFQYGGQKYKLQGDSSRESTDVLFDTHGMTWLFGTVHKYVFRYTNLARERDLFKIATYMYLLWLKRGFFCKMYGVSDPLDTSLELKNMFYDKFKKEVAREIEHYKLLGEPLGVIGNFMSAWSNGSFTDIDEVNIVTVFILAYKTWERDFGEEGGKDRDTWNK